jgi:hypothetical protein
LSGNVQEHEKRKQIAALRDLRPYTYSPNLLHWNQNNPSLKEKKEYRTRMRQRISSLERESRHQARA